MQEPLGLPRGSVRAIITLLVVGAAITAAFVPMHGDAAARNMLIVIAGIVVRDYFGHRAVQNEQDGPALPAPAKNEAV